MKWKQKGLEGRKEKKGRKEEMKEELGNIHLEDECRVKQYIVTCALEHSYLDTLSLRMVLKGSVPRGFAKV